MAGFGRRENWSLLFIAGAAIFGQLTMMPLIVTAADPDPLQDFCIANLTSNITLNGFVCKNRNQVTNADFVFHGLDFAGNTSNYLGSAVTTAFVSQFPGINTQGISMARLDFGLEGLNQPHVHPRASEILFVVNGTLLVGFVDTTNKLWSSTLQKGDVTVFPRGQVHFQLNVGKTSALAIVALGSQNPGRVDVGPALFASDIPDVVLEKTFNLTKAAVDQLKAFFSQSSVLDDKQDLSSVLQGMANRQVSDAYLS